MIDIRYATHSRKPFFQIAKDLIYDSDKILDIGAGDGKFADFCNREDMYLFEGNAKSASVLSKRFKNVKIGNLPSLPYEDEFFDIIHMSHVIEHLNPQDVYESLKEINRCCKAGGCIIISAPLLWSGFYNDLSHVRPYPPESFIKYLSMVGPTATRPLITDAFKVENLKYRYLVIKDSLRRRKSTNLYYKILYKLQSFLKTPEIHYEKTGYTIVLRKKKV